MILLFFIAGRISYWQAWVFGIINIIIILILFTLFANFIPLITERMGSDQSFSKPIVPAPPFGGGSCQHMVLPST